MKKSGWISEAEMTAMPNNINPIIIGGAALPNNVFLAPMAGITDRSFRTICREQGCGLTYSEMVSAKSILYDNVNTKKLLDNFEGERPFAVQIFGSEPHIMAEAARKLERLCAFDILDINMGCPAPKIVRNGEGSALMKEPLLAGKIVEAVTRATSKPVTIKTRKGFTPSAVNAVEIARIAQESGAAAVTIHGRTRDQYYSGTADWEIIARVKDALTIPVIGNGDITSPETAAEIFELSKCDGIMIARGALGNPWVFSEIIQNKKRPVSRGEKTETALRHGRMMIEHKGERVGVQEMRKHLSWYIKGQPAAAKLRVLINKANTYKELEELLQLQ
jgi:nifR3 family TIM-barrel protein